MVITVLSGATSGIPDCLKPFAYLHCVLVTMSLFPTHTVRSFVEMIKLLLTENRGLFLLSERFSQDSLENYLGKQRARGGRNENPMSMLLL